MEVGLIGYPLGHSRSPWIHQHFFDQIKVKGNYHLIEIKPEEFVEGLNKLKHSGLSGFNVTIPYKEEIIPYLDEISSDARQIGAVNTVVCKGQKWYGYNTDGIGLITALKNNFPALFNRESSALILGAGGASRGIYFALQQEGFSEVTIANRTIERAERLIDLNPTEYKGSAISFREAEQALDQFDLIIQTTSVGMQPNEDNQVIDLSNLKKGTVVSDIVYQPFWTKFLKEAKRRGAFVHHGHEMLIYQAKHAFELWTGQTIDQNLVLTNYLNEMNE